MEYVRIRELKESDAEYISSVLLKGFNWFFKFHEERGDDVEACRYLRESFKPEQICEFAKSQGDNVKGFVAEFDGKVVGYIVASFQPGPRLGSIGIVSVDPGYQRRGIGSMLMEKALEFLRSKGARKVYTTVSHINRPAIMYYLKHGFIPEGFLREHFSKGIHEILMSKFFEE
ncbi:MAG: GNAT family N-acetyltransferase [Candidatus Bathyarchaeia archaeon]